MDYADECKNNLTKALHEWLLLCGTNSGYHEIIMWVKFTDDEFICGMPIKASLKELIPGTL